MRSRTKPLRRILSGAAIGSLAIATAGLLPGAASAVQQATDTVTIHAYNSAGSNLQGVLTKYACGAGAPTVSFGTTNSSGVATKNLPHGASCVFTSVYRGTTSAAVTQTVVPGLIVEFRTSAVTVHLSDHLGGALSGGKASYQAGVTTYGLTSGTSMTNAGGDVVGELFDGTYDFRMEFRGGTVWKYGIGVVNGSVVPFQTGQLTLVYSGVVSFGQPTNSDYAYFTKPSMELLPGTYVFHPRGVGYPANTGCKSLSITSPDAGGSATKTILAAQLRDSTGAALGGGRAVYTTGGPTYYLDGDTDALSGASCLAVDGALSNVTVTMGYRATSSSSITQDVTVSSIFAFRTSAVTVTLSDHSGGPLAGGMVAYKSGGTTLALNTGTSATDASGQAVGQLFDGSYDFRMVYNNGVQWKAATVAGATSVAFQTGLLSVVYSDVLSYGGPTGDVAYFTKTGTELLPGAYNFHPRNVGYPANSGCRPISITSPDAGDVATKTIVAAQLRDSSGAPLTGTASYYPNAVLGWLPMGDTDGTGSVCTVADGALGTVSVRMTYQGTSTQKAQAVATDSVFAFQTTDVTVLLRDHDDAPLDTGSATYYAGGWKTIGTTSSGSVHAQMLQGSYAFAMSYLGTYTQQNAVPVAGATTTVTFRTGQVHSETGSATSYYAGSWKTFTNDMELLPGTWTFGFSDIANTQYTILPGVTNYIH